MERRLAAIMAVDVVGYSRMVGADETGTLERLKQVWTEVFAPAVESRGGRIFKMMGDGALVEFTSVVGAVECAAEVQEAVARRNQETRDAVPIAFRIGVNLGDIVRDGEDMLGDGVNVAARLEAEAPPGGVLTSDAAHSQIQGKVGITFVDAGEISLKNIDRPLRVWRWQYALPARSDTPPAKIKTRDQLSIAVLPFDNMLPDPADEFFADGLSEDIITGLSRIRWFLVIARNSTFTYKGRAVDVTQVGRELGVRYVLEGSVRKAGNRIRVTAQLIDAESGTHIWAERYDRQTEDIFDLQDEITATIVGAVEPELSEVERKRAATRQPDNLDAWECYQRGLDITWAYDSERMDEGIRLLERATELDPDFASAYGYLAYAYYESVIMGWSHDPAGFLEKGLAAGRAAIRSDARDPVAWFGYARIQVM